MSNMFYGCNSLSSIILSNFDKHNIDDIDDMNQIFYGCDSLNYVDLSNF